MVTGMVLPLEFVPYGMTRKFEPELLEAVVRDTLDTVAPSNVTELAIASTEPMMIGAGDVGKLWTDEQS
jgi:hypothetical protein